MARAPGGLIPRRRHLLTLAAGVVLAVVVLALLLALSDLRELVERAAHVRMAPLGAAGLLVLAALVATGASYHSLFAAEGHRLPAWATVRAVALMVTLNRVVRSAGITGLAVLAWLLARHRVPATVAVTTHVAIQLVQHALFTGVVVVACGLAARAVLAGVPGVGWPHVAVAAGVAVVFAAALVLAWLLLRPGRARRAWTEASARLAGTVGRRVGRPEWADRVRELLNRAGGRSLEAAISWPGCRGAWLWSAGRLAVSVAALELCVRAAGLDVPAAALLLAYVAARASGVVSMVPAGLGVTEASLVGVLAWMGVDYESALLVALLFRLVDHLVPSAAALAVSGPVLRDLRRARTEPG